jgi:branched-subunit amino acid ABC-type transport system permease component
VVTPFIAVSWIPLIEFGLFVVVLVVFPQGIFGKRATS